MLSIYAKVSIERNLIQSSLWYQLEKRVMMPTPLKLHNVIFRIPSPVDVGRPLFCTNTHNAINGSTSLDFELALPSPPLR